MLVKSENPNTAQDNQEVQDNKTDDQKLENIGPNTFGNSTFSLKVIQIDFGSLSSWGRSSLASSQTIQNEKMHRPLRLGVLESSSVCSYAHLCPYAIDTASKSCTIWHICNPSDRQVHPLLDLD